MSHFENTQEAIYRIFLLIKMFGKMATQFRSRRQGNIMYPLIIPLVLRYLIISPLSNGCSKGKTRKPAQTHVKKRQVMRKSPPKKCHKPLIYIRLTNAQEHLYPHIEVSSGRLSYGSCPSRGAEIWCDAVNPLSLLHTNNYDDAGHDKRTLRLVRNR